MWCFWSCLHAASILCHMYPCVHWPRESHNILPYWFFSADLLVTQYCSRIQVSQCKMAAPHPGRNLLQSYTTSRSFDVSEYALKSQLHNQGWMWFYNRAMVPSPGIKLKILVMRMMMTYVMVPCNLLHKSHLNDILKGPAESQRIITLTLIHSQLPITQPPNPESARRRGSKLGKKRGRKRQDRFRGVAARAEIKCEMEEYETDVRKDEIDGVWTSGDAETC